jgi:polygalacturonase
MRDSCNTTIKDLFVLTSLGLAFTASSSLPAAAQDTRTVLQPVIPTVCAIVPTRLDYQNDRLPEEDEVKLDTDHIQRAMDHCKPGYAVELKAADEHNALLSGPLTLRPGVTLVIDKGVHLVASKNPQNYDRKPGSCGLSNISGGGCKPLITALRADRSGIMGEGVIEGRGDQKLLGSQLSWWQMHDQIHGNVHHNIPWLIGTESTNDFTLYGITLRNAPNFNVFLQGGDGITVWGIKIDSPGNSPNTDGIDPSGCSNVTITHSYIRNGDDNVAIKAPKGIPATHITISHNHFYEGHGMSIGSGTEGGVNAVRVTDLTIDRQKSGIHIKSNPGRGGLVTDVVYDDVCIRDTVTPINLESTYIDANAPREGWIHGTSFPDYTNIVLRNVRTEGGSRLKLSGIGPEHMVQVRFDGVTVGGIENMKQQVSHAQITLGPGPANWVPKGDDVLVSGTPAKGTLPSCNGKFVGFSQ